MAGFREYKIGSRIFAIALGGSMSITLLLPSINIASVSSTDVALTKQLAVGHETGFNLDDPFLQGRNKPIVVALKTDPKTGQPLGEEVSVYVYKPGTTFPAGILHPRILGAGIEKLSVEQGHITDAQKAYGAVFAVSKGTYQGKPFSLYRQSDRNQGLEAGRRDACRQGCGCFACGRRQNVFRA